MSSINKYIQGEKPVLIDFYAQWCGPCKVLSPEIDKVAGYMKDKIRVTKVDIDKNARVMRELQIKAVPTMMLFKDGRLVWRKSGVMAARQIETAINKFL